MLLWYILFHFNLSPFGFFSPAGHCWCSGHCMDGLRHWLHRALHGRTREQPAGLRGRIRGPACGQTAQRVSECIFEVFNLFKLHSMNFCTCLTMTRRSLSFFTWNTHHSFWKPQQRQLLKEQLRCSKLIVVVVAAISFSNQVIYVIPGPTVCWFFTGSWMRTCTFSTPIS